MESKLRYPWIAHIPNALSLSRLALAFCFPFAQPEYRLLLIAIALLSEFLDGFLARRLNAITPLGQMLDPIADKLFVVSAIGVLVAEQRVSLNELALVAMRDLVAAIGSMVILTQGRKKTWVDLQPRWSGKWTTAFQFILMLALYLNAPFQTPLLYLTIVMSFLSAIDYLQAGIRREWLQEPEPKT